MAPTLFSEFNKMPLWLEELIPPSYLTKKWNRGQEISDNSITDKSILICNIKEESFVAHCERKNLQYGVISITDENLENYMGYATSNNCKFIIRGYFHPHIHSLLTSLKMTHKLLHIYPGISDEFMRESRQDKNASLPSNHWCFAGELKPTREKFLKEFQRLGQGNVLLTNEGFAKDDNKKTALKTCDYYKLIKDSLFTPCPTGWVNIDTYRFYEALEAGSIPVVLRNACPERSEISYWETKFQTKQDPPFVQAKNWEEARKKCNELIQTNSALARRDRCRIFWRSLKNHWKAEIKNLFENSWD